MNKRNISLSLALLIELIIYTNAWSAPASTTDFIHIDQFGYLCNSSKVAVISDPQTGYNSTLSFSPSSGANQYQLRDWNTDVVVFTGTINAWNAGATHIQSGDKAWWFDFSSVTAGGSYYIFDVGNSVGSYKFQIGDDVYNDVLIQSLRMYYYQRVNFAKQAPFANAKWTDAAAFDRTNQDRSARPAWDKTNSALARDMSGGWFDAGDYNKYVTFTFETLIQLLEAYRENPSVFGDNNNIPESGNGIPDILDEVKYELDWLLRMQDPDGSAYIKVGHDNFNTSTPPSTDANSRYYVQKCGSASRTMAAVFALSSIVYRSLGIPSMTSFGDTLLTKAEASWNYFTTVNTAIETSCDDQSIKSGDADMNAQDQVEVKFTAAVYLWEATGNASYKTYAESNYTSMSPYSGTYWGPYGIGVQEAMLKYTTITGANSTVANNIRTNKTTDYANGDFYTTPYNSATDPYRAYMPDWAYHWGSNQVKANAGNVNLNMIRYNISPSNNSKYKTIAEGYMHFMHGVNPQNVCMLSNMYGHGADKCTNEFFHGWFADGSIYDNALTSPNGNPPGYLIGGINAQFAAGCGGCYASTMNPPTGQPVQKSYKDWNTGWNGTANENSWEITEPGIYYQAAYVRLLSRLIPSTSSCVLSTILLSSFTAQNQDTLVILNWATSSEQNSDHFVIERSTDGINFSVVDSITAAGNSSVSNNYTYTDTFAVTQTVYYRLVTFDTGSNSQISGIISVAPPSAITGIYNVVGENNNFIVYPNPFGSSEILIVESKNKKDFNLTVFDVNGKTVFTSESSGSIQRIAAGKISKAGIYFAEIKQDGKTERMKIIQNK
jgi:endoglucanase